MNIRDLSHLHPDPTVLLRDATLAKAISVEPPFNYPPPGRHAQAGGCGQRASCRSWMGLELAAPIRLVGLRPRYAIDDGTAVFAQFLVSRQGRIPATNAAFLLQQLPESAVLTAFDWFAHVANSSCAIVNAAPATRLPLFRRIINQRPELRRLPQWFGRSSHCRGRPWRRQLSAPCMRRFPRGRRGLGQRGAGSRSGRRRKLPIWQAALPAAGPLSHGP